MNFKILMPKDKEIVMKVLDKLSYMGYSIAKNIYNEFSQDTFMDVLCVYTEGFTNEDGVNFPKDYTVLMEESDFAFKEVTNEESLYAFSEDEIKYYNDYKIVSWHDFLNNSFRVDDPFATNYTKLEFLFSDKPPYKGRFRWVVNDKNLLVMNEEPIENKKEFIRRVMKLLESEESNLS